MNGKRGARVWAPLLVLGVGLLASLGLVSVEPSRESGVEAPRAPVVPVVEAATGILQLEVRAQGTVEPETETDLVVEVPGRVAWTAPAFRAGGYVRAGEPLLRLDRRDAEAALERSRAAVERAASQHALAKATLERRRTLRGAGAASRAALDEAESRAAVAAANLREARAVRAQVALDLDRTEIRSPFDGRVRARHLTEGQFAGRGSSAARIYSSEAVLVRLPIASQELAYLSLPFGPDVLPEAQPEVTLEGHFAGQPHRVQGRIVRTEGALDPETRMVVAVARVEAAASEGTAPRSPGLPIGLFVDARITGRVLEGVIDLPRGALLGQDEVWVVDDESKVRARRVTVLRADGERAWISSGLEAGERVAVRALGLLREGMEVRPQAAGAES
jgi:RND family efflux transporter MFP subunit